jgi:hypothetical protein
MFIDREAPHLIRAAPRFVPAHVDVMDDPL